MRGLGRLKGWSGVGEGCVNPQLEQCYKKRIPQVPADNEEVVWVGGGGGGGG